MSLIIGGISVGGALGTAAIGAVGSSLVGGLLGGGSDSAAVSAADPFAGQRGQYQSMLQGYMTNPDETNSDRLGSQQYAVLQQNGFQTSLPTQTTGGALMQQMLTPGYTFDSTDPSYKFRLEQGAGALASSNAARGLLNSGAAATALMDYGQGMASTEFANQFARAGVQDTSQQRLDQNTFANQMARLQYNQNAQQGSFSNMNTLNTNLNTMSSNLYQRLAQLSGANIGSTATAGQLQANSDANASAGASQLIQPVVDAATKGIGNWWNSNN